MDQQQILKTLNIGIVANDFAIEIKESFKRDDVTVIQGLLEQGLISVDARFARGTGHSQDRTLLMHAATIGADAVVTFLLAEGANPTLTDVGGKKAYDLAAERSRGPLSGQLFRAYFGSRFPGVAAANNPPVF